MRFYLIAFFSLLSLVSAQSVIFGKTSAESVELVAGEVLTLDFPELGNMADEEAARCEVRIPENYTESGTYPLFVWFGGGKGNYETRFANTMVDFDQFIVVALPYPDGRFPRLGVRDGGIEDFWAFQYPMLERIKSIIPNISEKVRIVCGTSSGGHLIGSALDLNWPGYTDYFTAYVLHEGGTSPNMTFEGVPPDAKVLIAYGGKSKAKKWQAYFIEKFRAAHETTTVIEIAEAGHGLSLEGRKAIHQWIVEEVLPDLETPPGSEFPGLN